MRKANRRRVDTHANARDDAKTNAEPEHRDKTSSAAHDASWYTRHARDHRHGEILRSARNNEATERRRAAHTKLETRTVDTTSARAHKELARVRANPKTQTHHALGSQKHNHAPARNVSHRFLRATAAASGVGARSRVRIEKNKNQRIRRSQQQRVLRAGHHCVAVCSRRIPQRDAPETRRHQSAPAAPARILLIANDLVSVVFAHHGAQLALRRFANQAYSTQWFV